MLKDRIQARLDALNISQFEASERVGKGRNFVYDILSERKKRVHSGSLVPLAVALECSVEYLLEETDSVGSPPTHVDLSTGPAASVEFGGVIEAGVLRLPTVSSVDHPPLMADHRYPSAHQKAFLYRGDAFESIREGMYVIAVSPAWYRSAHGGLPPNATLVVERLRTVDGEHRIERFLKRLRGPVANLRLAEDDGSRRGAKDGAEFVVGIVVAAYQLM